MDKPNSTTFCHYDLLQQPPLSIRAFSRQFCMSKPNNCLCSSIMPHNCPFRIKQFDNTKLYSLMQFIPLNKNLALLCPHTQYFVHKPPFQKGTCYQGNTIPLAASILPLIISLSMGCVLFVLVRSWGCVIVVLVRWVVSLLS